MAENKQIDAIIELNHCDGTTEFIGRKTIIESRDDGSNFVTADMYYGALEDYESDRYCLWKLPPKASPEDPNYPGMGFSQPDLILEWEEIDWSRLCVARCPDAELPWLEQHRKASLASGGCCNDPSHGKDGTIYRSEDERRSAESGGDSEISRDSG